LSISGAGAEWRAGKGRDDVEDENVPVPEGLVEEPVFFIESVLLLIPTPVDKEESEAIVVD
jgi:hypothetical protein